MRRGRGVGEVPGRTRPRALLCPRPKALLVRAAAHELESGVAKLGAPLARRLGAAARYRPRAKQNKARYEYLHRRALGTRGHHARGPARSPSQLGRRQPLPIAAPLRPGALLPAVSPPVSVAALELHFGLFDARPALSLSPAAGASGSMQALEPQAMQASAAQRQHEHCGSMQKSERCRGPADAE